MTSSSPGDSQEATAIALEAMAQEAAAITRAQQTNADRIPRALQALRGQPGKLIITGLGKSGHIGRKIAATMSSIGTPAVFVHSTEALHGDSGVLTPGDAMIAISNSGETTEVCSFALMATRIDVPLVALTAEDDSTLGRLADVVLSTAVEKEADPLGLAPTSSTTVTLALGDAVAIGLMHLRGFTPEDFHRYHPGGSLGAMLSKEDQA